MSTRKSATVTGLTFKPYNHESLYTDAQPVNGQLKSSSGPWAEEIGTQEPVKFANGHITDTKSKHALCIRELCYRVRQRQGSWWKGCCFRKREEKDILRNINMSFKGGLLTGVVGNSGSGKTSLLDVISSRHEGEVEGRVTFDGQPLTEKKFRNIAGYVIQTDRLLANLTVRETLTFTAMLKMSGNESTKIITSKVDGVLSEMGLNHVANSLVGGHLVRGISGGERRRVSIAVQLLQDPYILLLDEPTTGLDSFTAHALVSTLATLAHTMDRIVLLTIHQPHSDIFTLFDNIAILCTGQVEYFGPRSQLVPYFTSLGHPCPTYANPLDFYVDLASIDHRSAAVQAMTSSRVDELHRAYMTSQVYRAVVTSLEHSDTSSDSLDGLHTADTSSKCSRFLPLLAVLLRRMFLNLWRDRSGFVHRVTTFATFAFFMWIYLWRLSSDVATAVQDRTGILFETLSAACMMGLLNAIALFPTHRALYYREGQEGLYSSGHMVVAYCVHILPTTLLASLLYAVWCYWGIGLHPEQSRFWVFFGVCTVQYYLGELMVVVFLGVIHNTEVASSICTILFSVFIVLGAGLIRSQEGLLGPLQWLAYVMFYKYSAEILVANEYHKLVFSCEADNEAACQLFTGDDYLDTMFPGAVDNMARNAVVLAAFVAVFFTILLVTFRIKGVRNLH